MTKYYDKETTPMKYYMFLTRFALIFGLVTNIAKISILISGNPFWADVLFASAIIVLNVLSLIWLRRMEWRGVQALEGLYAILTLRSSIIGIVQQAGRLAFSRESIVNIIVEMIVFVLTWVYFNKRRTLFKTVIRRI